MVHKAPLPSVLPFWLSVLTVPLAFAGAAWGGFWIWALPLYTWGLFSLLDAVTGRYEGPSLFVGGATSDYLADRNRPAVLERFPSASIEMVPEAGHWVHVEAPEAFARIVAELL